MFSKKMLLLCGCVTMLFAHEFVIKPSHCVVDAESDVPFQVMVMHRAMVSEEIERREYTDIALFADNKKGEPVSLVENEIWQTLDGKVTLPKEGAALIVGHRRAIPWSKTTKGMEIGNKETLKGVIESSLYEKFCKVLLLVDDDNTGFDAVIGDRLELVPLTDSDDFKVGEEVAFQVLLDGKPFVGVVSAGFDGFSIGNNTFAFSGETNAQGIVQIPLGEKGLWYVRVATVVTPEDTDLYKDHNITALYVFDVR